MSLHNMSPSSTPILKPNTVSSSDSHTPNSLCAPAEPSSSTAHEPLWIISDLSALVIGVDEYENSSDRFRNLKGAVADADAVSDFLKRLGVPEGQICNVRNKDATRVAIETKIEELGEKDIKKGAPILIFYAGHGAEANAPPEWPSANRKIQMLAPHDFIPNGSDDSERGQGVLDMRLSRLLADLAAKQSDNITVILDCCYSGSGTRTDGDDSVRGIELDGTYTIPTDLLRDLEPDTRGSVVAKGFETEGQFSHVLLAACGAKQKAREKDKRGVFTSALLSSLEDKSVGKLTYTDVVKDLSDFDSEQTPQCKGYYQSRCIFNLNVPSKLHRIQPSSDSDALGQYVLDAGEARGITNNAQFDVYAERTMVSKLGTVVVSSTTPSKATCKFSDGPSMPFSLGFALQTGGGKEQAVNLLLELDSMSRGIWDGAVKGMENKGESVFRLVKSDDKLKEPDLVVTVNKDRNAFHFKIMDKDCRRNDLTDMPFEVKFNDSDTIPHILQSSANFYWHLRRSKLKGGHLAGKVTLECVKLRETGDLTDDCEEVLMPDPNGSNLNSGGVIEVDADDITKYGFKLTNTSKKPLYVSMFYFDVSGLVIESYYTPATAKTNPDAPLPPKQSLILGYGEGGEPLHTYYLRKGQRVDVGFLKLFISTENIDMSGIAQGSPFSQDRMTNVPQSKIDLWDAMCFTLVQKKK